MKHFCIFLLLLSNLLSHSQTSKEYDLFLGDTINVIDKNGSKQGRWVSFGKNEKGLKNKLLKHNQIITDGIYLNNEKNGLWRSYHSNTNKIKSEVTYLAGEINGRVKLYDEKGRLTHEGSIKDKNWAGDYSVYNSAGQKNIKKGTVELKNACLKFNGTVAKGGKPLEDIEITIEKNELPVYSSRSPADGTFSFDLELQNEYVITFSKKGFNKTSVLINANTESIFDTATYLLKDWKVAMTDNFAASATSGIFNFIINKATNKIHYSKRKKEFTADGSYENLIKKQLNGISNSTKLFMATTMETNKKLEIENLRIESEAKLKQIELLRKEQELQQAKLHEQKTELLTKKLEAEKKEQAFALLQQEKKIKELKIQEQQNEALQKELEAEKRAREIEKLSALSNKQKLDAILQKRKEK